MRTPTLVLAAALIALLPPVARGDDGIPIDAGPELECLSLVPHPPADPLGARRVARIALALDGVDDATAHRILEVAARPFDAGPGGLAPGAVALQLVDVHGHSFASSRVRSGVYGPGDEGDDLMSELTQHYRAAHAELARDHVHLLTSKNLYMDVAGSSADGVAGVANCIGSIGRADISYSISEVAAPQPEDVLGVPFFREIDAKVAAHEIGHALGAHHHYANCAEPVADAAAAPSGDVCTLMFNDVSVVGLRLGTAEWAAMRGTVESHLPAP